jgi:hypothetical protein
MKRTFKYDVAISAVDFDALAAAELQRRLEQRIRHGVFTRDTSATAPKTAAATTLARHAFEKDSRVVVVFHQRLWGTTPSTEADAAAIRARITKTGRRGIYVIQVDATPLPSWLKVGAKHRASAPAGDAAVDQIVDAVVEAGGVPYPDTVERLAARKAVEDDRARARASFLSSQRAITLVTRELDKLSAEVTRCCGEQGRLPEGLVPAVRRTPDRYTVQIGPVGLSFSWIRGRSNSIADGQLLVIEWSGHLADKHVETETEVQAAIPTFEHVLQPQATGPEDWQWRRTDLDLCSYTTRDLAAQCVTSVLRRLPRRVEERPAVRERVTEYRRA